jgi:tRNA-Thr(GGU) m(6)t(6)A37 methyltransferase TsaA
MIAMAFTLLLVWTGWRSLQPIGEIRSIYSTKFGAPRQGAIVPDAVATLTLSLTDIDAHQALEGLNEYSHVWLLWAAHLNEHDAKQAKVRAPHLRGDRAGLFSTRSPFRPNPIGLSLVRLEAVQGNTLRLSGVDLVDGTPVLDIKPYLPYADTPSAGDVRVAEWVDPPPLHEVTFALEAEAALKETSAMAGALTSDVEQLRRALVQTLAADPRPVYRWRREQKSGGAADYDVHVDGVEWRCRFELASPDADAERVTVLGPSALFRGR